MIIEIGDKVTIDSEGYCGSAYVCEWHERGAYVSVERGGKPFFVLTRSIVELR